jgi:SAM-dependent methyltransferase
VAAAPDVGGTLETRYPRPRMAVVSAISRIFGLTQAQLVGSLDAPGPRQPYARTLEVVGWALSTDGEPIEVVIEVDGRAVWASSPRAPRPDVGALFPKVPGASACGFSVALEADALPAEPEATLIARVRRPGAADGQEIGRSIVTRPTQPGADFTRTNYAQVWDRESQTEGAARTAVCGTDDANEWARSGEATAGDVRELAAVTASDEVLEIGCGAGRVGRFLAPHCRRWIGGDVSQNMLRFAAEALADLPNVSTVRLNGYDLSGIADASLDVVYCTGVFMHLDEWERFRYIEGARRVLRPGGRLYVDNFNLLEPDGWAFFIETYRMDPMKRPANVSRHSTPQELEAYVTHAGFTDVRVRTGGLWVTVVGQAPAS